MRLRVSRFAAAIGVAGVAVAFAAAPAWAAITYNPAVPITYPSGTSLPSQPTASFTSISCPSIGNCVAVGSYRNGNGETHAVAQSMVNGVWEDAVVMPDVEAGSPYSSSTAVSCSSAGNCAAVGSYQDSSYNSKAFSWVLVNGVWGTPAASTFAGGVHSSSTSADNLVSVSCPSNGSCVAAGTFSDANGNGEAFTQALASGTWSDAVPAVFPTGVQDSSPSDSFKAVSCSSSGNCTAVGTYFVTPFGRKGFSQTMTNGTWAPAVVMDFDSGVENTAPYVNMRSLSCSSAGNCTATGDFKPASGGSGAFTWTMTNGVWALAIRTTLPENLMNSFKSSSFRAVSCSSNGNCVAVGQYQRTDGNYEPFSQTMTNGVWATAAPATFAAGALDSAPSDSTAFNAVSCTSPGNCTAVGKFAAAAGGSVAFWATLTNGVWGIAVPATFDSGVQNSPPSDLFKAVSCPAAGNCTAAGQFRFPNTYGNQAFTETISAPVVLPATGSNVGVIAFIGLTLIGVGGMTMLSGGRRAGTLA